MLKSYLENILSQEISHFIKIFFINNKIIFIKFEVLEYNSNNLIQNSKISKIKIKNN